MTAGELITGADALHPNAFSTGQKLLWLRELDMMVADELLATHAFSDPSARPAESYTEQTVLLVPEPYGRELYSAWIYGKMDMANGESDRFNRSAGHFNSAWRQYADYVNRTTLPLGRTVRL